MTDDAGDRDEDGWLELLREHAVAGTVLDLAPHEADDEITPVAGESWPAERTIPAGALRRLLLADDVRIDPRGLQVRGARITGDLDLSRMTLPCHLALERCHLGVVAAKNASMVSLDLDGCRVTRMMLDGCELAGDLRLNSLRALGEVRAVGATVGGQLYANGAQIGGSDEAGLSLDGIRVRNGVFLARLRARGPVRALHAQVTGQLDLSHAVLDRPGSDVLSLDGLRVDGDLIMPRLSARGGVRALGARATGDVILTGAAIVTDDDALSLDRAQIEGSVFLRETSITGPVRAPSARIGSQLSLVKASLDGSGGQALRLDGARIGGGVFLAGAVVDGEVCATAAELGGQLQLQDADLSAEHDALSLEGATIANLGLGRATIDGNLNLRYATIGVLAAPADPPGRLVATGWQLGRVHGPAGQSWRAAQRWLETTPQTPEARVAGGFVRQPWQEMADVLDRAGRPEQGRRLRFEAERQTTRRAPWWSRPVRRAYEVLVGYGLYPLLAGAWMLLAALLTLGLTLLFPQAFAPTDLAAASTAAVVEPTGATACAALAEGYPCFAAPVYALEVMLPVAQIGQLAAWAPAHAAIAAAVIALRAFVWLMTALLLAGVTGLLRRR